MFNEIFEVDRQTSPRKKMFTTLSNFRRNRGPDFSEIPGNCEYHNVWKCKNIRVSRNHRDKIQIFPEKCRPRFLVFVEIGGHPFREFPGIHVDKITKNTRIYVFPEILDVKPRFFPGNFYEIPKFWIFLNFRKPRNFGERVTSSKKTLNFQFSVGFSLNFVELIRYTPHPNLRV